MVFFPLLLLLVNTVNKNRVYLDFGLTSFSVHTFEHQFDRIECFILLSILFKRKWFPTKRKSSTICRLSLRSKEVKTCECMTFISVTNIFAISPSNIPCVNVYTHTYTYIYTPGTALKFIKFYENNFWRWWNFEFFFSSSFSSFFILYLINKVFTFNWFPVCNSAIIYWHLKFTYMNFIIESIEYSDAFVVFLRSLANRIFLKFSSIFLLPSPNKNFEH